MTQSFDLVLNLLNVEFGITKKYEKSPIFDIRYKLGPKNEIWYVVPSKGILRICVENFKSINYKVTEISMFKKKK